LSGNVPSHEEPHVVPKPAHVVLGAIALPEVTVVHVPFVAARLHAWHWFVQVVLQHTPSTQWVESQSKSTEHVAPLGRARKSSSDVG
jgi:hypothetical protein